jgi:hypothetical protein
MTGASKGVFAMKPFHMLAAGLSAAAALSAGQARAAVFILDYTATNGAAPAEAKLAVHTADVQNAVGGYDITDVSGDVDGDTVTGLIANPGQPFASYSADGRFIFDNVLWTSGAPTLSNPGLFFAGASGDEYNLFSDNARTYELYKARGDTGYLASSVGVLAAAPAGLDTNLAVAVPEPAAWTLMIVGFGAVGALLRRRRSQAVLA